MPITTWGGGEGILGLPYHLVDLAETAPSPEARSGRPWPGAIGYEDRHSGLGAGQLGPGLLHVPLGGGATLKPGLGDRQTFLLGGNVLEGDLQPLFQGADGNIKIGRRWPVRVTRVLS